MPWGPNLVVELPLPCVGWDRGLLFFPNTILAGLEGREIEVPYEEHRALCRAEELLWPRGGGSRAGGLSLHGWWVQGAGRMLCWVLDAALLPAGAALLEDTGTIIVSAGFLSGWQKEGTQYTGWHVSLLENVLFKTARQGFLLGVGFPAIPRRVTLVLLLQVQGVEMVWVLGEWMWRCSLGTASTCVSAAPSPVPDWQGELCVWRN